MSKGSYKYLNVVNDAGVLKVVMNKPKSNPLDDIFFNEIKHCFQQVRDDSDVRCCVLSSTQKHFTVGLDLMVMAKSDAFKNLSDPSRTAFSRIQLIQRWQDSLSTIASCGKPVIALVHGACIGGGIDMISFCDIRLCTSKAIFSIKEVDIGIVPDIGTMARVPKIIGNDSLFRELAMTGRNFNGTEALALGLVSRVFEDRAALDKAGMKLARELAGKSPIALLGIKEMANYAFDHSVAECNNYVKVWNGGFLQSDDVKESIKAFFQKRKPKYSKL